MKGQVLPTWCLYEVSLPSSQSSRAFADSTQRWCSEAGFCVSAIDDEKCDRIHDVTKEGKKNVPTTASTHPRHLNGHMKAKYEQL